MTDEKQIADLINATNAAHGFRRMWRPDGRGGICEINTGVPVKVLTVEEFKSFAKTSSSK